MTESDPTTINVADESSHVGVQAGTVHGGVHVYSTSADAPPEEKFETGVRLLNGGMPTRARQLIREAVEGRYINNRVCFYWQLALVSGRTRHEMSPEDTTTLRRAPITCRLTGNDAWAAGVRTICRLLDSAQQPDADLRQLLNNFDVLGNTQRTLILRHLELFLDGPLEDQMWHRALAQATYEQKAGDRLKRIWKFFEPEPAPPRVRPPRPPMISTAIRLRAVMAAVVFVAAAIHIGYLLTQTQTHRFSAGFSYLLCVIGGYACARNGLEWRYRVVRRRTLDERHRPPKPPKPGAPKLEGFTKKVDRRFDHYFAKYVPRGVDRSAWLAETAGIRKNMRDEIVEVFRESRVGVEKISWLIRYRVSDVRNRWQQGTLWSYREELATSLSTKTMALLGAASLTVGAIQTMKIVLPADPLNAVRSAVIALLAAWFATRAWLHIALERRRYAADDLESAQTLEDCMAAFDRWRAKLADKPEDSEMAAWLDCDRKVLLNGALQHYRLSMSNVIAYAFIEAPAASTARARVRNGPWRYTKYHLLTFLLTPDGVRQVDVTLDFKQAAFHDQHRTNYRYEAVAAVRVRQADDDERRFELTLVNGEAIKVDVIGPGMEELQQGENPGVVSEVTLDTAGLQHTLHVLEGIAAEGKEWITHERRRAEARTPTPSQRPAP